MAFISTQELYAFFLPGDGGPNNWLREASRVRLVVLAPQASVPELRHRPDEAPTGYSVLTKVSSLHVTLHQPREARPGYELDGAIQERQQLVLAQAAKVILLNAAPARASPSSTLPAS